MTIIKRYIEKQVIADLKEKMVFISGPRQVGKTTFAKSLIKDERSYLNWDYYEHREMILKNQLPLVDFIVFDEIHKYKGWSNFIKGVYDVYKEKKKIIVTGSGRLDIIRRGGDSLQGRYHMIRFLPLTLNEIKADNEKDFIELLELSPFPEPFFSSSKQKSDRWTKEYRERLVYDEINTVEKINDISKLELLMIRLPELVGSPLSLNSLVNDIGVSHKTVARWINVIEMMFGIFRICPFGVNILRAVKKEQKHYHYDYNLIKENSFRFENFVALHLYKWVCFEQDKGNDIDLRYIKDVEGREIDFVIVKEKKPITFVECKWSDVDISNNLKYIKKRFPDSQCYQIYAHGKKEYEKDRICLMPAYRFLKRFI
jgi:predicted AAA+ superfamily ATPase